MSAIRGGFNRCRYSEYEDGLNGTLDPLNYPAIGAITLVDPTTGLVSGNCIDMRRPFTNAICVSLGGSEWGVTYAPRVDDVGVVLFNITSKAIFIPFGGYGISDSSDPYKVRLLSVDEAADRGFKRSDALPGPLDPGEVHAHSYGHSETLMDNMGNWFAADGVGDYVYMDAANATLNIRALNGTIQNFGFDSTGAPGVTITAGIDEFDSGGAYLDDLENPGKLFVGASWYTIQANGGIVLIGPGGVNITIGDTGIFVDPGTTKVTLGSGDDSRPALFSITGKTPMSEQEIGVSKNVYIAVNSADLIVPSEILP